MEIWLIHTTNFTARIIHTGMKLFCWFKNREVPQIIYNHALISDNKVIWEASLPTVNMLGLKSWYIKKKNLTAIIKKIPLHLNDEQELIMRDYLSEQEGKKYEVTNFWWHLVKIFTNKWYGKQDDKQHYCYELVIYAYNKALGKNINPYLNPVEVYDQLTF